MPRYNKGIDKYLYCIIDNFIPFFCNYNIHPNIITLIGIILNYFLFYYLSKNNKLYSILLIIVHCILDFLDGEIARKCNKQSDIGGLLDTISDVLFMSIILLYYLSKYSDKVLFTHINIILLFLFVLFINKITNCFDIKTHETSTKTGQFFCENNLFLYFVNIILIYYV